MIKDFSNYLWLPTSSFLHSDKRVLNRLMYDRDSSCKKYSWSYLSDFTAVFDHSKDGEL